MNTGIAEEIRKALDAATPGPWYVIKTEVFVEDGPICKLWGDGLKGEFSFDNYQNNAHLIANAPTLLRSLLEENERLKGDFEAAEISLKAEREENERITKEKNEYKQQNYELVASNISQFEELEDIRSELAEKNKVLEEIATKTHGSAIKARSILSQYAKEQRGVHCPKCGTDKVAQHPTLEQYLCPQCKFLFNRDATINESKPEPDTAPGSSAT